MLLTALADWKRYIRSQFRHVSVHSRRKKPQNSLQSMEVLEDRSLLSNINGVVFHDLNANQIQEAGEAGLAGVTVYLDGNRNGTLDTDEDFRVTDSNGNYAFENLAAGDYLVRQIVPEEFRQTSRGNDPGVFYGSAYIVGSNGQMNFVSIDGATGQVNRIGSPLSARLHGLIRTNDGRFFGLNGFNPDTLYEVNPSTGALSVVGPTGFEMTFGLAYDALTDTIYGVGKLAANDPVNRLLTIDRTDGSATPMGPGTAGMTGTSGLTFDPVTRQIIAFDNDDDEFYAFDTNGYATRISDLSGRHFWSLAFDTSRFIYQQVDVNNNQNLVAINPITGQQSPALSLSEAAPLEALEWVGDPSVFLVSLAGDETVSINIGNDDLGGTLQGTKFLDLNGNGSQDENEPPLAGVTVFLDLNDNGILDQEALEPFRQTDADGQYAFINLEAGEYIVREIVPEGYQQTSPREGGRLFAFKRLANPDVIVELDPSDGSTIREIPSPIPGVPSSDQGLAFDGSTLYLLANGDNMLYELDPDTGTVLDQTQLPSTTPSGSATHRYDGLASLGGFVYVFEDNTDALLVFDPATNQILSTIDITTPDRTNITFDGSLGALTGPDVILIGAQSTSIPTAANTIYLLDPTTGAILSSFQHTGGTDGGLAGIGDEIFVGIGLNPPGRIEVYDRNGNLQRTLDETTGLDRDIQMFSLAGGAGVGGHHVTLEAGQVLAGLDFGNRRLVGEIRGTKFEDVDGDGTRDSGEGPMVGVTIYLDLNGNGTFDPQEPSSLTDANGDYALTGLPPGDYVVREIVPENFRQTTPETRPARLFTVNINLSPDAIFELDPLTGAVMRGLPSPVPISASTQGLAFDGKTLYYISANNDLLFELNPETGAVLDSFQLPLGTYVGAAVIDGRVYLFDDGPNVIYIIDPMTNTIERTYDLDLVNPGKTFAGALGEFSESGWLIIGGSSEIYFLDPETGVIVDSFSDNILSGRTGLTGIGNEVYVGYSNNTIRVFDSDGDLLRTIATTFQISSLGGDSSDGSHRVTLEPAQILTGLDFGNQSVLGEIRGTKFEDVDGDGVRDLGEGPLRGVTVYLDLNDNGQLELGQTVEPDDFSAGTELTNAFDGVTLSVAGSNNQTNSFFKVRSGMDPRASTGDRTFFEEGISFWTSGFRFRADFDQPTSRVSLDFIGSGFSLGESGVLLAFNAAGDLIETFTTPDLSSMPGTVATMTIDRAV